MGCEFDGRPATPVPHVIIPFPNCHMFSYISAPITLFLASSSALFRCSTASLLVLGRSRCESLTSVLLGDHEDVVHVGSWEAFPAGGDSRVLRASTYWRRAEPLRNMEIVGLEGDVDASLIVLPASSSHLSDTNLSSFTPLAALALYVGIFRFPEMRTLMRWDAGGTFCEMEEETKGIYHLRLTNKLLEI